MNWLAIIVAVIINQALSFVWYSQLFGKIWLEGAAVTPQSVHTPQVLAVAIVAALLAAIALTCMIRNQKADTALKGAKIGVMAWLGFVGPVLASHYLFLGHSWTIIAIDAMSQLVNFAVMGAILTVWRKK